MKKLIVLLFVLFVSCKKTEIAVPLKKGVKSINLSKIDSIIDYYTVKKTK